ncbi:hypothetical protein AJ80_09510 [Polytolypa hystricis UAMH7299]|uniref:Uncharacterized protein n=1 Tax=Polytolypa hystricis (strain UAMH7299) TaxID=1447883 RepID=A0A2B7WQ36_POLH7|nr:hypothetical protein AJ80_09510 [Polytolypa hystricis UAMH7299]
MALALPPAHERKRVKVYELRDNDWFDRGTGLCTGQVIDVRIKSRKLDIAGFGFSSPAQCLAFDIPRIYVESEDQPDRVLLETRVSKEDGYQKQQETLIVWTEQNGVDMALSFQEPEGCAVIWDFLNNVQQNFPNVTSQDEILSDDALDGFSNQIMLPHPELGNLADVEQMMRNANNTQGGRDALSKFVIRDDYITKLLPLVSDAEDLESLADLHRLCNIMKSMILLNDNTIIEQVVSDHIISGVVGALEYDPDFPTHKANHRQYLNDRSRYKEVVPIKDPIILRKIRHTWRLQYLKDVVLARILDDPTFSVLNSLIFFNQVDIVQHLQDNGPFLNELFSVFSPKNTDIKRKEDAVQFLHQCAAIAKNLQTPARANLYANFIGHGLFGVIAFAVKHPNPAMRTTGIDILVALLDHDPLMMRGYMLKAVTEKKVPLTDTLIDLLHAETDLGVKGQLGDAIKVLLDPQMQMQDPMGGRAGSEYFTKLRLQNPHSEPFMQKHFDESAKRLFTPLKQLESRPTLNDLTFQEVSLHFHLVDILTFFIRQHPIRSRAFVRDGALSARVAQLLTAPQKHLKLTALKFFRTLIGLQDTFYHAQMTHNNTFELIINIVYETMPRDNLLNSACLELFEFIKRETIKPILIHIVEKYRDKLQDITYVDTFQNLILRYDQMQGYGGAEMDASGTLFSSQEESTQSTATTTRTMINGGQQRWHGIRDMDTAEQEYFDESDDEEEEQEKRNAQQAPSSAITLNGGVSPIVKPLVDYPDDEDEDSDTMDVNVTIQTQPTQQQSTDLKTADPPLSPTSASKSLSPSSTPQQVTSTPPLRYTEKRRRDDDDDDDELIKLSSGTKRRSSSLSSINSSGTTTSSSSILGGGSLRKKKGFSITPISSSAIAGKPSGAERKAATTTVTSPGAGGGAAAKKIAINLNMSTLKPIEGEEEIDGQATSDLATAAPASTSTDTTADATTVTTLTPAKQPSSSTSSSIDETKSITASTTTQHSNGQKRGDEGGGGGDTG